MPATKAQGLDEHDAGATHGRVRSKTALPGKCRRSGEASAEPLEKIRIERSGQFIRVRPFHQLLKKFVTQRIRMASDEASESGTASWGLRQENVPLYEVNQFDGEKVAYFRAGMELVLHAMFASEEIAIECSCCCLPKPMQMSGLPTLPPGLPNDIELLRILSSRNQLLLRIDRSRYDVAGLLAQVAILYPDQKIVVALHRKEVAKHFAARLAGKGIKPTTRRDLLGVTEPPPPIAIDTIAGLDLGSVDLRRVDLLVFPDAIESLGKFASALIDKAHHARVMGFLDLHELVFHPDEDGLLQRFGPGGPTILYHGSMVRPVMVDFVRFNNRLPIAKDAAVIDVKRAGIWQHRERNRFVASLYKSLMKIGVDRSAADRLPIVKRVLGDRDVGPVVVLVEAAEHAEALRHQILDGPVTVAANPEGTSVTSSCIVTAAELPGMDLTGVKVLLRADGGTGLPPGVTLQSRSTIGEPHPLIVLDIHDRHHPELRQHAGKRRQAYLDAGWPVGTGDDAMPELARFLAPRHRRTR